MSAIASLFSLLLALAAIASEPAAAGLELLEFSLPHVDQQEFLGASALPPAASSDNGQALGLVLTGGGGRGFLQIGALKALDEAGIPLHCIVGTSMGAVIGGLYAVGYAPDQIQEELTRYTWGELFNDSPDRLDMYTGTKEIVDRHLFQLRFRKGLPELKRSFSSGQRVTQILSRLIHRAPRRGFGHFDELLVPYRAMATDLVTGRSVALERGDLSSAMRASMSIPLLFSPVVRDSMLLIDGGITANIPVQAARALGAERVLVVDATNPLRRAEEIREAWEVADQVIGIMQERKNREALAKADLVLRPEMGHSTLGSFDNLGEVVEEGYRAMREALPQLKQLLEEESPPDTLLPGWDLVRIEGDPAPFRRLPPRQEPMGKRALRQMLIESCDWGTFQSARCDLLREVEGGGDTLVVLRIRTRSWPQVEESRLHFRGTRPEVELPGLEDLKGVLNRNRLQDKLQSLLGMLRSEGYSLCTVDSLSLAMGRLNIYLDPGRIEELRVEGLRRVSRRRVLAEFRPGEGELFRLPVAEAGVRRLHGTNLFESVSMALSREPRKTVVIHVEEKSNPVLRFGLRWSSAREGQGFVELDHEALLAGYMRGSLYTSYGAYDRRNSLTLNSDRILSSLWTVRLELIDDQHVRHWRGMAPATAPRRVERMEQKALLSFGRQWQGLGTVYVDLGLRRISEEYAGSRQDWLAHALSLRSIVDSRDRIGLPTHGELHVVELSNVLEALGSDDSYLGLKARFDSWRTLMRLTLHSTFLWNYQDSPPLLDRTRLGGGDLLRSQDLEALQGAQAGAIGLEARWRLADSDLGPWYLGCAWRMVALNDRPQFEWRAEDLRQDFSAALSVHTLAGPLEAGAALASERRPGDSRWRLWAELGFVFP